MNCSYTWHTRHAHTHKHSTIWTSSKKKSICTHAQFQLKYILKTCSTTSTSCYAQTIESYENCFGFQIKKWKWNRKATKYRAKVSFSVCVHIPLKQLVEINAQCKTCTMLYLLSYFHHMCVTICKMFTSKWKSKPSSFDSQLNWFEWIYYTIASKNAEFVCFSLNRVQYNKNNSEKSICHIWNVCLFG